MFFKIAALGILAAFYGCYFWKMLEQRKKGIQTDQMGRGKTGAVKAIECVLKAASVLVVIAEVVSIAFGTSSLPLWARLLGTALGIVGVAVFTAAVVTMRDSWRAGVPEADRTELVTGGIFAYSRNPAFLGFDLLYIGMVLMFFNWGLFLISAFAAMMLHLQIVNVEEDFLLAAFGDEYLAYRKKVNRYLGRKKRKSQNEKFFKRYL